MQSIDSHVDMMWRVFGVGLKTAQQPKHLQPLSPRPPPPPFPAPKVDLPFAWAAGLRRGLEAGLGAGAAAAAAGGPTQEQIQEMADDMEVDVQGVKTTHSGEIKILKPHHIFPLQSLTEKQKKTERKHNLIFNGRRYAQGWTRD